MKNKIFTISINDIHFFLSFILFTTLLSCNNDSYKELSGNYFYKDEGEICKQIISHLPNKKEIYSTVTSYDYNSDFIIARQLPNYDDYKTMIAFELRSDLKKYPTNSINDFLKSEKLADSILKNNNFYNSIFINPENYWIIEIKKNKLHGPLTKSEFINASLKLKISSKLKLN